MGVEPALTFPAGSVADLEPMLEVLPVPLLLVEPGSARLLYANAAAHRLAGGVLALGEPAGLLPAAHSLLDEGGRVLAPEETPLARAARGETLRNAQIDWVSPVGSRTLLVSGATITLAGGGVVVISFEDVTGLENARRNASGLAGELRATLDGIADAVTVQSADGGLVYVNRAAERLFGIPGESLCDFSSERYVSRFEVTDDAGGPFALDQLPGRLALSGRDPEPLILRTRDRETGEVRWSRIKASAVREPDGAIRLAINLVEDITELKRSEQAQRFLAEASRALAGSLDTERTLAAIRSLVVPQLAERCELTQSREGQASAAAVEVMRSGEAQLADTRIDVPLTGSGRVLGALTLHAGPNRRYDRHDLRLAEDLGLRTGAALANARLYRAAVELARTLQTSLLPPRLPDVPGVELAAVYRPAGEGLEVGGDFYDAFTTGDGQWYLALGDVCGKGAEAAAVTALARYTLRTAAARRRSPAAILRWVGEAMLDQDAAGGRFCTIVCAHLDLTRTPARVTVSCGGHPLPVVRRACGSADTLGAPGTLLGLVPDPELQERSTDLQARDVLVLYTDGLTEARAPHVLWGTQELLAAVRGVPVSTTAAFVEGLVDAALDGGRAPRDDVAVLAARMR